MSSWVRYCVAVYVGLLLSGALAKPPWARPALQAPGVQPASQRATPMPLGPAPLHEAGREPDATAGLKASATLGA